MKLTLILSMLVLVQVALFGCKSTEDLRREKMLEDISSKFGQSDVRFSESGQMLSNHSIKLSELESLINKNNGAIEEIKYRLTQDDKKSEEKISMLSKRLDELFAVFEERKQKSLVLEKEVNEQKKYIEEVLVALDKIKTFLKEEEEEREKKEKDRSKKSHKKDKSISHKNKDKDKDKGNNE
ncbi:MAG: hypothetical protein HQK51_14230 [Oligoflexia bacterium]|nr:hypothetical protein [Oligoflexia bacterium]